ncbi:COX15/CtaA family protein [Pseudomarimonas arenosa]|uniref:COX15/CtaA family protein n=1 Tax=Pseudomarimonas arenosa TaxID=2774145 RepID=A0AAW3ZLC1_9GAMM|nr:COX15/CtaA family protein [Pseudomarimonas arenosa]MBD8525715.1 COX15/CtaA family protein [Pseudomarimonas arenosa]
MISPHRHFHRLAWAASLLALVVIVFGGFVRLSHAGLSCPDWPTCYGKATWPVHDHEVDHANEAFPQRAVEVGKAWREQVHRHLAATLGLMVLGLAMLAARHRPWGRASVMAAVALIAPAIPLYMSGHYAWSAVLTVAGELILLIQALRWSNQDFSRISVLLLMVIVFQATLGLWTVSWLLKPIVVMAHLLGGLLTFSLLIWTAWRSTPARANLVTGHASKLKRLVAVGIALVTVQIALGGWTSSNYAALACGSDFPTCSGQWWPATDFEEGFVLWRGIGVDYEGGVLDGPARTAIHLSHRLFSLLVFGHLLFLALRLRRSVGVGAWGWALGLALGLQMALGISNVIYGLPLAVATAHLAGAALLLFILVTLIARLRPPREA